VNPATLHLTTQPFATGESEKMSRFVQKRRKSLLYPWTVRRFKNKVVIEIARTRILRKKKAQAPIAPDCHPELW